MAVSGAFSDYPHQDWGELSPNWQQAFSTASQDPVAAMVWPERVADLADLVALAHHHQIPLLVAGSGSKLGWGSLVRSPQVAVSTQKLDRLLDHAVADLTVTVEAGMPLHTLQAQLAAAQQWWPVDPLYSQAATIGGIIATGDTGSLRHRYGGVRDLLLGVSFVRADGRLAKAGGRVVKNVAGYDLMKLMSGSFGTLGILVEVTLRLYPLPPQRATYLIAGDRDSISRLSAQITDSPLTPTGLDVLGSAWLKDQGISAPVGLLIQIQGSDLGPQTAGLQAIIEDLGLMAGLQEGWEPNLDHPNLDLGSAASDRLLLKLRIPPHRSVFWADWLSTTYPGGYVWIHRGGGIGRWWAPPSLSADVLGQVRSRLQAEAGSLTLLEAPLPLKQAWDVWGIPADVQRLMGMIRQQFDPLGILNPGKLG